MYNRLKVKSRQNQGHVILKTGSQSEKNFQRNLPQFQYLHDSQSITNDQSLKRTRKSNLKPVHLNSKMIIFTFSHQNSEQMMQSIKNNENKNFRKPILCAIEIDPSQKFESFIYNNFTKSQTILIHFF